jgi:hypothetical protein
MEGILWPGPDDLGRSGPQERIEREGQQQHGATGQDRTATSDLDSAVWAGRCAGTQAFPRSLDRS